MTTVRLSFVLCFLVAFLCSGCASSSSVSTMPISVATPLPVAERSGHDALRQTTKQVMLLLLVEDKILHHGEGDQSGGSVVAEECLSKECWRVLSLAFQGAKSGKPMEDVYLTLSLSAARKPQALDAYVRYIGRGLMVRLTDKDMDGVIEHAVWYRTEESGVQPPTLCKVLELQEPCLQDQNAFFVKQVEKFMRIIYEAREVLVAAVEDKS